MAVPGKVLIAGGGIGGLATALALAQKGIASLVLEKASQLGEIGAGIQLGPNAFHCFDRLGVGEAARGMAVYIDHLRLMDAMADGEICHIDLGEAFRARYRNPYAVVHRGDLHGVLLKACRAHPSIALEVSSEVTGYEQDGKTVTAKLANGKTVAGAALIGADGLWSERTSTHALCLSTLQRSEASRPNPVPNRASLYTTRAYYRARLRRRDPT